MCVQLFDLTKPRDRNRWRLAPQSTVTLVFEFAVYLFRQYEKGSAVIANELAERRSWRGGREQCRAKNAVAEKLSIRSRKCKNVVLGFRQLHERNYSSHCSLANQEARYISTYSGSSRVWFVVDVKGDCGRRVFQNISNQRTRTRTYKSNIEENCMLDKSKSTVQDTKSTRNRTSVFMNRNSVRIPSLFTHIELKVPSGSVLTTRADPVFKSSISN